MVKGLVLFILGGHGIPSWNRIVSDLPCSNQLLAWCVEAYSLPEVDGVGEL